MAIKMNLTINTTCTFENLLDCKSRVSQHIGGTRSGKTYAIIQFLIVKAIENQETITIVRKTIPSLKRTVIKDFKEIMQSLNLWKDENYNITDRIYNLYDSTIQFLSTDDADKLRGIKSSLLFIDEVSEIDEESYFQLSIRTSGNIILAYNPTTPPTHWLRRMQDVERFITTYKDNVYLPADMVKAIEDLQFKNPRYWSIYGKGEFASNDKQIYNFEIVDEINFDTCEFVCFGMDIGYVKDPTALVSLWKSGDNLIVNEHIYQRGLITADIIEMMKGNVSDRDIIVIDSSEPRLIDEIKRGGFPLARGVKKGKDSVQWGIDLVKKYNLVIQKNNTNLIEELYSYEWLDDGNGNITNIPIDAYNHLLDAMRYGVMEMLNAKKVNKGRYAISFV